MRPSSLTVFAVSVTAVAGIVIPIHAGNFVETFDDNQNIGGWTYFLDFPTALEQFGGNPGWHIPFQLCCDFFPPNLHTTTDDSAFTGDYRAAGVTAVSVDVKVDVVLPPQFEAHSMSLYLCHDNDTPDDPTDDWGAWYAGGVDETITADGVWRTIAFQIPTTAKTLPDGWQLLPNYPLNLDRSIPATASWNTLIADVASLSFEHGPPVPVFFEDHWIAADVHHDNITITFDETVIGDLTGDAMVNGADLLVLLNEWSQTDSAADLDGDGIVGGRDLLVLLNNWT